MRGDILLSNRTSVGIISNVPRGRTCFKSLLVGSHDVCQYCSDNQRDFGILGSDRFTKLLCLKFQSEKREVFSSFKLLVVFWKIKKVYVAQELLGMWNLKLRLLGLFYWQFVSTPVAILLSAYSHSMNRFKSQINEKENNRSVQNIQHDSNFPLLFNSPL